MGFRVQPPRPSGSRRPGHFITKPGPPLGQTQKPGVLKRRAECQYIPRVLKGARYQLTLPIATFSR